MESGDDEVKCSLGYGSVLEVGVDIVRDRFNINDGLCTERERVCVFFRASRSQRNL